MKQTKFSKIPFDPSQSPFFYGWIIIVMGTLGLLMSIPGQTIGCSTFTDSLIEALDISRDNLSLAYMVGTICSSLLLTRAGKLFDRFGARSVAVFASVCLGLGLIYMGNTDSIISYAEQLTGLKHLWVAFTVLFLGFMVIRFFGQGVLTLSSKAMMMKWFDERRGFALGFSSVFVSGGFSIAPAALETLIQAYNWKMAWIYLGVILIFIFPLFVFLYYRDDPSDVGLKPDGNWSNKQKDKVVRFPIKKEFELHEARRTLAFWLFAGFLGLQGLYITGFTFHVISIFQEAGYEREATVKIFQYFAIIAISVTVVFSWLSDYIKLKYLLYIKSFGAFISIIGVVFLEHGTLPYIMLILGTGLSSGMYGVVSALCWPRFFGKKHLGAIFGQVMMILVFGSALGPILFSKSLTIFGTYDHAAGIIFIGYFILFVGVFFVSNPQEKIK